MERIQKEQISGYKFQHSIETDSNSEISKKRSLIRACQLGNSQKGKVKIRFQTTEGVREVYTTIWGVTPEYIGLKNGTYIPVNAIISVDL